MVMVVFSWLFFFSNRNNLSQTENVDENKSAVQNSKSVFVTGNSFSKQKCVVIRDVESRLAVLQHSRLEAKINAPSYPGVKDERIGSSFHFRNVCLENKTEFVFFENIDGSQNDPYLQDAKENEWLADIRPVFHNIWEFSRKNFGIRVRRGRIPSDVVWSPVKHHVLLSATWPSNIGHALFDDIFSTYRLLRRFDVTQCNTTKDDIIVLYDSGCSYWGGMRLGEKGCRFLQRLVAIVSNRLDVNRLSHISFFNKYAKQSPLICMRNLYVGSAADGMGFKAVVEWDTRPSELLDFKSEMLHAFHVDHIFPTEQLILFCEKRGRRAPANWEKIVQRTKKEFPKIQVMSVDLSELTVREQLKLIRLATVAISPIGGGSLLLAGQSPFTTRILISCWNVLTKSLDKPDENLWKYDKDVKTLYYPIRKEDIAFPEQHTSYRADQEFWKFRNHGIAVMEFKRILPLIELSINRAADAYGF